MSYGLGTVKARRMPTAQEEYALIDRWGYLSREDRRIYWTTLQEWERRVLIDSYGRRDAQGE